MSDYERFKAKCHLSPSRVAFFCFAVPYNINKLIAFSLSKMPKCRKDALSLLTLRVFYGMMLETEKNNKS